MPIELWSVRMRLSPAPSIDRAVYTADPALPKRDWPDSVLLFFPFDKYERSYYFWRMVKKGKATRDQILREATDLASVEGLEGLTIGALAFHTGMSKSGLFAHFGSKEALQLAVLEAVRTEFIVTVVAPARKHTGRARVEALFENWLAWASTNGYKGGCPFVAAAVEWDDRDGPIRDAVHDALALWQSYLARAAQQAIDAGEFRVDLDPAQFAFDVYAIELGFHNGHRLMGQKNAARWTRDAYARLIADASVRH